MWQAIRPWGRSVSVHQGKGLDAHSARIGAAMEAIECARAEAWEPREAITASFRDLPEPERASRADDFAWTRGELGGDELLEWAVAEGLGDGKPFWVPELAVSLNLCRAVPGPVERTSNGQGAGFDLAQASLKALCELIERDAFQAWSERSVLDRS
ncbi:MAG TPA: YcaO-like family protein, partial [Sphingomonas sp.]|nr:YcaO-like family protein [Sphingomonas sp.]